MNCGGARDLARQWKCLPGKHNVMSSILRTTTTKNQMNVERVLVPSLISRLYARDTFLGGRDRSQWTLALFPVPPHQCHWSLLDDSKVHRAPWAIENTLELGVLIWVIWEPECPTTWPHISRKGLFWKLLRESDTLGATENHSSGPTWHVCATVKGHWCRTSLFTAASACCEVQRSSADSFGYFSCHLWCSYRVPVASRRTHMWQMISKNNLRVSSAALPGHRGEITVGEFKWPTWPQAGAEIQTLPAWLQSLCF